MQSIKITCELYIFFNFRNVKTLEKSISVLNRKVRNVNSERDICTRKLGLSSHLIKDK